MDELDREWAELLGNIFRASGLNEIFCRVCSVLYIQPEEISLEDLAQETGYSRASMSNSMKMLVNAGLVKRMRKPGTKKIFFYMEKDLVKLNKQKFKFAIDMIDQMKLSMPDLIKKYEKKAKDDKSKKKLKIIKNYYKQTLHFQEALRHLMIEIDKYHIQK